MLAVDRPALVFPVGDFAPGVLIMFIGLGRGRGGVPGQGGQNRIDDEVHNHRQGSLQPWYVRPFEQIKLD